MESLIYIEPSEGELAPTVKQIATKLRQIPAELRGTITGVAIGTHLEGKETELSGLVDEFIIVEATQGSEHNTELISNVLTDLMKVHSPGLLFLGFTHHGMELAPVVGMRLGIPTITGCTDFELADNSAKVKRLAYSSKFTVSLSVSIERGAIFSVQRGSLKINEAQYPASPSGSPSLTKIPWCEDWVASKSETLKIIEEEASAEQEDITKASLLVSVGRGIGGPNNIPVAKELADKLGGVLSCSRPVVDNDWLPAYRQVGTSGKTVSPVVYLALGISGQGNHLAGMDTSRIIIAVNKDPAAPIFKVAHYGVIDNIFQFIPEVVKQMEVES